MQPARILDDRLRPPALAAALVATLAGIAFAGCGMPGAPQPPSLNLPVRVSDLSAVRSGDQVSLTWTMPAKSTDKAVIGGPIAARICRNITSSPACSAVAEIELAPGSGASFTDALPPSLTSGPAHAFTYYIEVINHKGRSAGLSNAAPALAGSAPPAIDGLRAQLRKDGVLLQWSPAPFDTPPASVRLVRKLLALPSTGSERGLLTPPADLIEQTLLVEPSVNSDRALDIHIRFGQTYEYRAQRAVIIPGNGQTLELASHFSSPIRIDAADVFPPSVPNGLAAVAGAGQDRLPPAMDLNWTPNTESDLAGYFVYRREIRTPDDRSASLGSEIAKQSGPSSSSSLAPEATAESSSWQRISPAQPVPEPDYRDATVEPGRTYEYAVSAIGLNGQESALSAEAQETVPAP